MAIAAEQTLRLEARTAGGAQANNVFWKAGPAITIGVVAL